MAAAHYSKSPQLVGPCAPVNDALTEYDRSQTLTYARLLDAERAGYDWVSAAKEILLLDVEADTEAAKRCWRSHLDRAHWFVDGGFST